MPQLVVKHPASKKFLAGFLVGAIVVLGGGGVYTWHSRMHDNSIGHGPHALSLSALRNHRFGRVDASGDSTTQAQSVAAIAAPAAPATPAGGTTANGQSASGASGLGIAAGGDLIFYDQAALNQYFSQLQGLGVKWVRWDLDWSAVQGDGQASYDWTGTDRVVATGNTYKISSLPIIAYTPSWARPASCAGDNKCAPADLQTFADFAGKAAARYSSQGVHNWEIWNEPNTTGFWKPTPSTSSYTSLLKASYGAIKGADAQAVVITGGLAAAGNENGDIAPITFVQGLYASGGQSAFDALGLHPYSFPVIASYAAEWNSWQQMVSIRQILAQKGDSGKKIWITEYGAPTSGPGTQRSTTDLDFNYPNDYMSEGAQSQIASDVVAQYKIHQAWLGPLFWYSFKDLSANKDTTENFFGLLRADNSKKPAYDIFKQGFGG